MANEDMHLRNAIAQAAREAANAIVTNRRFERMHESKRLKECIIEFAALDHRALHRKTDKELAEFQSDFPQESPQYALAANEWNRRLVTRQVRATQHAAWVGLAGVIIGALMGWFLSSDTSPNPPNNNKNAAGQETSQQHQGANPDQVPPKTTSQPPTK